MTLSINDLNLDRNSPYLIAAMTDMLLTSPLTSIRNGLHPSKFKQIISESFKMKRLLFNTGAYPLPLYLSVCLNDTIEESINHTPLPTQYVSNLLLSSVLGVPSDLLSKRSFFKASPSTVRVQLAYLSSVTRDGTQLLSYTQDPNQTLIQRALVGGVLGVITAPFDVISNNCVSNANFFSLHRLPTVAAARFSLGIVSCTVFNVMFDRLNR